MDIISRSEAAERGLTRYFTGVACTRGHVAQRYVVGYGCVACYNEQRNARRAANRVETRAKNNAYLAKNRDKQRKWWATHYEKYKEHHRKRTRAYSHKNRKKISKRVLAERETNIQSKLAHRLRERLRCALKRSAKTGSAVRDLGCSVAFLVKHIEAQFTIGMSWKNWGVGVGRWNVDHIEPLSKFDLTDRKQLLLACHYTNLRPLWALENMSKGAKAILRRAA
jgi:hypothetical protein